MTQIARFAQLSKVDIGNVRAKIRLTLGRTGSILGGTIRAEGTVATQWEIEAPVEQDVDKLKRVLRAARDGCWARQLTARPTDFEETIILNGEQIE